MKLIPVLMLAVASIATTATSASGQTLEDIVSFLLTNRSITTNDFARDEQAALATRDAITTLLLTELGTLPNGSSSSGFTYRLDPNLGTSIRASESFGPLFTDRSLTAGAHQVSFGISYQQYRFRTIDGRSLGDGTLVATASKLRTDAQPFDVETLMLQVSSDAVTVHVSAGVTDRLDIGAALPIIRVSIDGQRVDNYRGTRVTQAIASGSNTGPGDAIVRLKYNALRADASGLALALDTRLPTGDENNLRGTGKATLTPRAVVSLEHGRTAIHGNVGYSFGGRSNEMDFGGGATLVVTPRLTLVGELAGRRLGSVGRLTDIVSPNPSLVDVDTIRLTTTTASTLRLMAVGGLKWNIRSSWLLSANVLRPLTSAGLNVGWAPTITIDRSFGF